MKFNAMFQPIEIGPMTVKNRFVVPPMGNNFTNTDGTMSEQSAAYYKERAKGGFGLITIEATVVHKGAKGGPRKPCLYDDSTIESFRKVIDGCHAEGAKVSIQLQNAGPEGNAKNAGAPITAATSIPSVCGRDIPKQLTTEEVYELIKGYGEAARRAMEAGADAVEIHMAHGYLVSTFLSPRTNKRVDEFGGCFENRMRFSRLIIEEIKKTTQGRIAILARINCADEVPGGLDIHDSAAIAAYLESCGLDAIHVSRAVHIEPDQDTQYNKIPCNQRIIDYFWLSILAVIIVISIIIAYYASAHEQASSQPVSAKRHSDIDVTFDALRSSLEDTSKCYLCGNAEESLMSYYKNFDTIGLISLNDWYVIDFPLKNYDENGNEIESAASTSFLSGNTGEIAYSSDGTPSRGMASIDVTLPINYEVDTNMLEKHLCQNCLNKVAASLEYRKSNSERKEAISLCIVDFKTLDIYSLQDYWRSYFVRDYYVEMDFDDNMVKTEVFYLPERQ